MSHLNDGAHGLGNKYSTPPPLLRTSRKLRLVMRRVFKTKKEAACGVSWYVERDMHRTKIGYPDWEDEREENSGRTNLSYESDNVKVRSGHEKRRR